MRFLRFIKFQIFKYVSDQCPTQLCIAFIRNKWQACCLPKQIYKEPEKWGPFVFLHSFLPFVTAILYMTVFSMINTVQKKYDSKVDSFWIEILKN